MAVDGQLVARTVGELRATLPQEGDLLVGLQRVVEATRTVVGVDGTGLTLAHEDGQPRWVAVSDAAMELLEQIQHDFGEGPCLAAFAEDRVVAVEDLGSERVWDRVAAVVGQLQVRGVLSVPVRLADHPVGDPGCVCQPAAGLVARGGPGAGGAGGGDRRAGQHRGGAGGSGC
jgi:GAF domain-containing protein